ncbi:DUF6230 family protein [Kitasatospora sp. NPDC127067]|uniref:DUF6230 family protein n=1 Tax=Kitasatospora sp. NPDC127067 TaxID=3347126 RepID=UPI00364D0B19
MSQTYGKTRWKRFALVMVPSVAATAMVGISIANNALAASFSVSGQSFKVTTPELHGKNFAQFGSIDAETNGTPHPVAVSAFDEATIKGLCQSVVTDPNVIPHLPWKLPKIVLRLEAGNSDDVKQQVYAKNLLIDLDQLNADAEFTNINIGQDASTLKGSATQGWQSKLGGLPSGQTGFAQAAEKADLYNVQQTAWATSAGTFKLQGLKLALHTDGSGECY